MHVIQFPKPLFLLVVSLLATTLAGQDQARTEQLVAELRAADWQSRRDAADELGELSPDSKDAVRALAIAVNDSDARVRRAAARALGRFRRDASPAVSALTGALDDDDPVVVRYSAEALGRIGSRASRAVPALRSLLAHENAGVRRAAADALGLLGRRASGGMVDLIVALQDPEPDVRAAAAQSLAQMGRRAAGAISALIELLHDEDPRVRASAGEAISSFGKAAVPRLVYALGSGTGGNPIFLQGVVDTLGRIGAPAAPELIDTLHDRRAPLIARRYIILALARIGKGHKQVVPALTDALDDGRAEIRMSAAEALGKIGPDASSATAKLVDVSRNHHEDVVVREYALVALSRISPNDPVAVSVLRDAIGDGNPRIHEAAVAAMMTAATSTRERSLVEERVSVLTRALEASDTEERQQAATELGRLGPDAVASVTALSEVVADVANDLALRTAAATALGLIGPGAETAVPSLVASLASDDAALRRATLVALQRIGPQTKTIPALMEAMTSGDLAVRGPAAASIQTFANTRLESWRASLYQSDAPVLRYWLERYAALYGVDASVSEHESRRRNAESADFFEVLGGRAAIRQSVQLHLIDDPLLPPDRVLVHPVDSIESISVASLPFDTLLKDIGSPHGTLPLADIAPVDHFFALFESLGALRDTSAGGADLFARFESAFGVKSFDYDLWSMYLVKLGLSQAVLDELAASGGIGAVALIAPDLYFVGGTDITVVAEVTSEGAVSSVLQLMGMVEPASGTIGMVELDSRGSIFWARRKDRLFLSTHRDELDGVLALADDERRESLGRSDEMRYMLHQLPMESSTQAYVFLSDRFIRHLVGPETKIAQLRRMQARAEMEMVLAGALLYRLDGHHALPTRERLIEFGYTPDYLADRDYTIADDLTVSSERFGSIAKLDPVGRHPVGLVSERELQAYQQFVDHYSRYWGQFFDPVAVRLDRTGESELEMTTLILPLADSLLYDQVRSTLTKHEDGPRLDVPVLSPKPSMLLSVNVNDARRLGLSKQLAGMLVEYASVDPEIFDSIGSAIHVAVHDATPIVALGAGDIWGALDEEMLRMEGFGSLVPIALSLATQPTTVLIELEEPERVAAFLNDAVVRRAGAGGRGEFHQLARKQAWIYTLDYENVIQLHLGVAVRDGYLIINNLPWRRPTLVNGVTTVSLNGAQIQLNLDTFDEQLPALHTKAFTNYRHAAMDGMGYLFPLLASDTADTVDDALHEHFALFGYRPVHPLSGAWIWQHGELVSSIFGTALHPVQPEFVPGESDFGLFPQVSELTVSMQLEQSGLRARVSWRRRGDANGVRETRGSSPPPRPIR